MAAHVQVPNTCFTQRSVIQDVEALDKILDSWDDKELNPGSQRTQLSDLEYCPEKARVHSEETIYVDFERDDKRNPFNFSWRQKWTITFTASFLTVLSASGGSAYVMGFPSMIVDLNCTEFQATVGLSVYALGFAVVPLVSASFSEEFGRRPLYIGSLIGFLLSHITVALSQNIRTVIVARFFGGAFGSTGAVMVGGTVADLWKPHERGLPMSIYSTAALGATALGPVVGGWIQMNPHLGWRWIQWIPVMLCGIYLVVILIIMEETRTSILLIRMAKKLRKETGQSRYRARVEDERASLGHLIFISCTRPIYLLFTEPTVLSFSLWIGFAWGTVFSMIQSMGPVFKDLHNFNSGEIGTSFLSMAVGTLLGFMTNLYQEKLYQRHFPKRGPEARLYGACVAAIMLPTGIFIYAWSSLTNVYWMGLIVGITIFMWATFTIYLAVFSYLADCYGIFASSALAGQSFFRNLMAMAFPLFTQQIFAALNYKWAGTLFGCIACLMLPIPFVLYFYGPVIRARSRFSRTVMDS